MKYITSLLHSLMLLVLWILVNSNQSIANSNGPIDNEEKSLYSHSKAFTLRTIPKNVAIFKYHCTINLTLSTVNKMVSCILTNFAIKQYGHVFLIQRQLYISNYKAFILSTTRDDISSLPELKGLTTTCGRYAEVKAFQYMLHQFLGTQNASNIAKATILSVMYLLQNAGEFLQSIQVSILRYKIILATI